MEAESLESVVHAAEAGELSDETPISVLVTLARFGHPRAALAQMAHRLDDDALSLAEILEVALRAGDRTDVRELVTRVLDLARAITPPISRDFILSNVAEVIAGDDPTDPEAIDRAVEVANTLVPPLRDAALARIAELIAQGDPSRAEAIDRAVDLAGSVVDDGYRSQAWAGIANGIAATDLGRARELMSQAMVLFDAGSELTSNRVDRHPTWGLEAGGIDPSDPTLIGWAVELANSIPSNRTWHRGMALEVIAEQIAASDPTDPEVIGRAYELTITITDDWHRSDGWAAIAHLIIRSDPGRAAELLDRAVELARSIEDDDARSAALSGLAIRIATNDPTSRAAVDRAVDLAHDIPQDGDRTTTMGELAVLVATANSTDPEMVRRALAIADEIPPEPGMDWTMVAISQQVVHEQPTLAAHLLDRAVAAAESSPEDEARAVALAAISQEILATDPSRAEALLLRAVALTNTTSSPEENSAHVGPT